MFFGISWNIICTKSKIISIMETCISSYVYLSISKIYLPVYPSVCMHVCMFVCTYVCVYLPIYPTIYLSIYISFYLSFLFSLPPKSCENSFCIFSPQKMVVNIKIFSIFSPPKSRENKKVFLKFYPRRREAKKHYSAREGFTKTCPMYAFIYFTCIFPDTNCI